MVLLPSAPHDYDALNVTDHCGLTCPVGYRREGGESDSPNCLRVCEDGDVLPAGVENIPSNCVSAAEACEPGTLLGPSNLTCDAVCAAYLWLPAQYGESQPGDGTGLPESLPNSVDSPCAPKCPEGQTAAENAAHRFCQPLCPDGKFWVTGATTSAAIDCVVECPPGQFGDAASRTCLPICGEGTYLTTEAQADDGLLELASLLDLVANAAAAANASASAGIGTNLAAAGLCAKSCKEEESAVEDDTLHACRYTCPDGLLLRPGASKATTELDTDCVTFCPRGYAPDADGNRRCELACSAGFFLDTSTSNCVPSCTGTAVATVNNKATRTCDPASNSNSPVWAQSQLVAQVDETVASGFDVGPDLSSLVSDADSGDELSFSILSGNGLHLVELEDPTVPQLSVAAGKSLDFEDPAKPNQLNLTIRATDVAGHTADLTLFLQVQDVNEPPVLIRSVMQAAVSSNAYRGLSYSGGSGLADDDGEPFLVHGERSTIALPMGRIFSDVDEGDGSWAGGPLGLSFDLHFWDPTAGGWVTTDAPAAVAAHASFDGLFAFTRQNTSAQVTLAPDDSLYYNNTNGSPDLPLFLITAMAGYGPDYSLQADPQESPADSRIKLRLRATDTAGQIAEEVFTVRVHVAGCTFASAKYHATRNPLGNFNPRATLHRSTCVFPPISLATTTSAGGAAVSQATTASFTGAQGEPQGTGGLTLTFAEGALQGAAAVAGGTTITAELGAGLFAAGRVGLPRVGPAESIRTAADVLVDRAVRLAPDGLQFGRIEDQKLDIVEAPPKVYLRIELGYVANVLPIAVLVARAKYPESPDITPFVEWSTVTGCRPDRSDPAKVAITCPLRHFSVYLPVVGPPSQAYNPDDAAAQPSGACPAQCNGHGYCLKNDRCRCYPGYFGYDCRQRHCPYGRTWSSSEPGETPFFGMSECSSRGLCDRNAGLCVCFAGFEGESCQRMACPGSRDFSSNGGFTFANSVPARLSTLSNALTPGHLGLRADVSQAAPACSGHGACRAIGELSMVRPTRYSSWDMDRIQTCVCDPGFFGADCSQRLCPHGDDPVTGQELTGGHFQIWEVAVDVPGSPPTDGTLGGDDLVLQWSDSTDGTTLSTPAIPGIWNETLEVAATRIAWGLRNLPGEKVPSVTVTPATGLTATERRWRVTFDHPHNSGDRSVLACPSESPVAAVGWHRDPHSLEPAPRQPLAPSAEWMLGCDLPGCSPRHRQLRAEEAAVSSGAVLGEVVVAPGSVLRAFGASQGVGILDGTVHDARAVVTVVATPASAMHSSPKVFSAQVFSPANSSTPAVTVPLGPIPLAGPVAQSASPAGVLGRSASVSGGAVPSGWARRAEIGLGLFVDFTTADPTAGEYSFAWSAGRCRTALADHADFEYEGAECSNRGMCDRKTGTCDCFEGYSNFNCDQMVLEA